VWTVIKKVRHHGVISFFSWLGGFSVMWRDRLVRELGVVLAIKLAILYLIWRAFFSAPPVNPGEATMEHMLLNTGSVINQEK
jgi:hypothetical protein